MDLHVLEGFLMVADVENITHVSELLHRVLSVTLGPMKRK